MTLSPGGQDSGEVDRMPGWDSLEPTAPGGGGSWAQGSIKGDCSSSARVPAKAPEHQGPCRCRSSELHRKDAVLWPAGTGKQSWAPGAKAASTCKPAGPHPPLALGEVNKPPTAMFALHDLAQTQCPGGHRALVLGRMGKVDSSSAPQDCGLSKLKVIFPECRGQPESGSVIICITGEITEAWMSYLGLQ